MTAECKKVDVPAAPALSVKNADGNPKKRMQVENENSRGSEAERHKPHALRLHTAW